LLIGVIPNADFKTQIEQERAKYLVRHLPQSKSSYWQQLR
jgi:hypothetical protein